MIIYKAENKINGKVYIGKTVGLLCNRKATHKKGAIGYYYNSAFHNAIRKHGWDNFEWSILCETDSESKLNALEKFYISAYRKMGICYNMTDGGEGASGVIVSAATREKLSQTGKGRKHSESTKLKFKEQRTGKPHPHKGHIVTPEEIIKRNETRIKNLKNRQLNV